MNRLEFLRFAATAFLGAVLPKPQEYSAKIASKGITIENDKFMRGHRYSLSFTLTNELLQDSVVPHQQIIAQHIRNYADDLERQILDA